MQVKFNKQWGPYYPGANPVLSDAEAKRFIDGGFAESLEKPADKTKPVVEKEEADADASDNDNEQDEKTKPVVEKEEADADASDNDNEQDERTAPVASGRKRRTANRR